MNPLTKLQPKETLGIIRNPHFWANVFIMCSIIALYTLLFYVAKLDITTSFPAAGKLLVFEFVNKVHGVLFTIPFFYATFAFRWRGAITVWLLSMVLLLPRILSLSPDATSFVRNIWFPFLPLLLVLFVTFELKWREKERKTLAEREAERQLYMAQIFKVQEDERQRIAQELHDDTVQTLLVIANRTQTLVTDDVIYNTQETIRDVQWIRDAVLEVCESLRGLSLDLRPGVLSDMGLMPAIRWLSDRLHQESNIDTKVQVKGGSRRLKAETDVIIFRIVQEALNNIRRHSQATKAVVALEFSSDTVKIQVSDNGKGFKLPETTSFLASQGKLGLIGMEQRSKFLNGTLDIQSEPGKGTSITFEARELFDIGHSNNLAA